MTQKMGRIEKKNLKVAMFQYNLLKTKGNLNKVFKIQRIPKTTVCYIMNETIYKAQNSQSEH